MADGAVVIRSRISLSTITYLYGLLYISTFEPAILYGSMAGRGCRLGRKMFAPHELQNMAFVDI